MSILLSSYLVVGMRNAKAQEGPEVAEAAQAQGIIKLVEQHRTKFSEALQGLLKALDGYFAEDGNTVWQSLSAMRRELRQWDEAIQTLEGTIALRPSDVELHVALAKVYMRRGWIERAQQAYTVAIQLAPERADLYASLGTVYSLAGRPTEAVQAFRKATALSREDPTAVYMLAQNLVKLGQTEEAKQTFADFTALQQQEKQVVERRSTPSTAFKVAMESASLLQQASNSSAVFVPAIYSDGFKLLSQGKYGEAITSFLQAAAQDPLSARAYFSLGSAYDKLDKLAEALQATQQAILVQGKDARSSYELGEICLALNQKAEARRAFEEAMTLDERFFKARLHLGSLAMQSGKLEAAISYYQKAVAVNLDDPEAHRFLGLAYWADNQYEKSIEEFRTAVRRNTHDERPRLAMAGTLVQARKFDDAERVLEEAIQAFPGSGLAHYRLSQFHYNQKHRGEAMRELKKAMDLEPVAGLDQLYRQMAYLYTEQMQFAEATPILQKSLEINPYSMRAHRELGDVYRLQDRQTEALAEYFATRAIQSRDVEVYVEIAQLYLRMGKYAETVEYAKRALEISPDYRQVHYILGNALLRLGKTEEAQQELQKFQQMQADEQTREHKQREVVALQQEVSTHFERGEYDKAIALLRKAVELEQNRGSAYLELGLGLIKTGQYEEGIGNLRRALELKADSPDIHRSLAEAYRMLGRLEESEKESAIYTEMKEAQLRWRIETR